MKNAELVIKSIREKYQKEILWLGGSKRNHGQVGAVVA